MTRGNIYKIDGFGMKLYGKKKLENGSKQFTNSEQKRGDKAEKKIAAVRTTTTHV